MPSGLIENKDGVRAGSNFRCNLVEMKLHRFGVAGWQHEGGTGSKFRADRTEHIGRLRALVVDGPGARALSGPTVGELVFLTHPHLILEPHFYGCAGRECRADFLQTCGKVFLNAAMASGSCL